jgi:alpha-beta hydrolase superfamily lysophospholipase
VIRRSTVFLAAMAAVAWAFPAWYPTDFVVQRTDSPELSRYLATERLDFAEPIHMMGTAQVDGIRLAVHGWVPAGAKGTVFLVHGYYSQSGIWSEHIRRLLADSLAVVAFDLPGHGLSDGQRMDVDSFGQYTKALRAIEDSMASRAPKPWMLVGHSMGSGVAIDRSRQSRFPYARVALLAPMLRYDGWTWTGLALPVVGIFKDRMERNRKLSSSSDTAFLNRLSNDPLEGWFTPLHWLRQVRAWNATLANAEFAPSDWLLVQGGFDKTVDWRWNMDWLQTKIPGLKTEFLPLARHHVHNEGGATGIAARKILDDFLTRPLPNR